MIAGICQTGKFVKISEKDKGVTQKTLAALLAELK